MDCDGVLAKFNPAYIKLIREAGYECPDESEDFPNVWSYDKQAGMTPEDIKKVWAKITNDCRFWLKLDAYPETLEFLDELNSLPIDLYFITNRPGIEAKWQTEQWLRLHGIRSPTVLITARKAEACNLLDIDYYIDDYDVNCRSVANSTVRNVITYMLARPWNRGFAGSEIDMIGIRRIKYLHTFLDTIKSELSSRKVA